MFTLSLELTKKALVTSIKQGSILKQSLNSNVLLSYLKAAILKPFQVHGRKKYIIHGIKLSHFISYKDASTELGTETTKQEVLFSPISLTNGNVTHC